MRRELEVRFRILRGGAEYGQLYAIGMPSLRCDDSGGIKMSLMGSFAQSDKIDWLTDEIQPVLVINGEETPLAVLMPATVTPTEKQDSVTVSVQAYDRCWRVRDDYLTGLLYFAAGTLYLTAIENILTGCGISLVLAMPSTAVLAEDREWMTGTSKLEIVNELLSEINYNPLWFNADGAAVLEPVSVPSVDNIEHTLDSDSVQSLLLPQITRQTDVYNAPNVFVCVCSNVDKSGPLVATAINNNPQSPLSVMRRGRQIVKVENVKNIENQDALDALAARMRDESMIGGETITVTTALLPGFGVADVTALHYKDLSAICIEKAWEMQLGVGGNMKHTLKKVVYNLG